MRTRTRRIWSARAGVLAASFALGLALWPQAARAGRVSYTLRWIPSAGSVTSYKVYIGTASMSYAAPVDIGFIAPGPDGIASARVPGFDPTSLSFAVMTAAGPGGESKFSNEISIPATQCAMSCDDGNPCTVDRCAAANCVSEPAADGSTCDDGDAATPSSMCRAGHCEGVHPPAPPPITPPPPVAEPPPVTPQPPATEPPPVAAPPPAVPPPAIPCASAADCSGVPHGTCEESLCDAALGCLVKVAPEGSACDDGNASTSSDVCAAGRCVGQTECDPRGAPRTVRLGWIADPAHYMVVQWDAPERDIGRVRFRPSDDRDGDGEPAGWTQVAVRPGAIADCEGRYIVELSGLDPFSEYEYQIEYEDETGPRWSVARSFKTAPEQGRSPSSYDTPFRIPSYRAGFIASMGVSGAKGSPVASRVIDALADENPDFVLGGGGYAYASDALPAGRPPQLAVERWLAQLTRLASVAPFLPVYGDTDVSEGVAYYRQRIAAFDHFTGASGNYSFDVGRTHYVALHAPTAASLDAGTLRWLDLDLAAAHQHGTDFLIVYMHTDLYSSHPAAISDPQTRAAFTDVLDRYNVNLVLSGGTPGVERSHPLRGGTPHPANGSVDRFLEVIDRSDGVVYLRAGSGGREDYLDWNPPSDAPNWVALRESRMKAFVVLSASGNIMSVRIWGVPDDGSPVLLDRFVLSSRN